MKRHNLTVKMARAQLRRLSLAFIRLATLRAPKGGINVQGEFYTGGQFIPNEVMERATPEERQAIADAKNRDSAKPTATTEFKPVKAAKQLALAKKYRANGHKWTMIFDSRSSSRGYYVRHTAPDGTVTAMPGRHRDAASAAQDAISRTQSSVSSPAPKTETPNTPPKPPKPPKRKNYRYAPDELGWKGKGKKGKLRDNIRALQILQELEIQEREATDSERAELAKFIGWGQLPEVFNRHNREFNDDREALEKVTTYEERQAASTSTANSHYTHPDIVKIHWAMAQKLGYKGGNYLEPAVGAGYYIGFMPEALESKSKITAIELDKTTGRIAKELYPSANVKIQGFQDTDLPVNYFDLVATNVPFDNETKILSDRKFKKYRPTLHDYYFLKSVDVAKPGGLIMHITSAGTMDKLNPKVREALNNDCELVSAVRFPGGAHSENAGTQVVTDMLILRKKNPAIPPAPEETPPEAEKKQPGFTGTTVDSLGRLYHWVNGVRVPAPKWDETRTVTAADGTEHVINQYFADHPEQMLGELAGTGSQYHANSMNVEMTDDYIDRVSAAIDRLPAGIMRTGERSEPKAQERIMVGDTQYNPGQLIVRDGKLYQYQKGELIPQDHNPVAIKMLEIRDAARKLMAMRLNGEDDAEQMAVLNELYDSFVAKHGALNESSNRKAINDDSDKAFTLSLEKYNSKTKSAAKADMFSKDTVGRLVRATKASNAKEAVGICLHESGKIELSRVAELLGADIDSVEEMLSSQGVAFRDPATGIITDRAIYLSGNVKQKLRQARAAAESDERFDAHVAALEASQPEDIDIEDISFKLGSPWIRPQIFEEFAAHVTGTRADRYTIRKVSDFRKGSKDPEKGAEGGEIEKWEVEAAWGAGLSQADNDLWGVKDAGGNVLVGFHEILTSALNGKAIKLYTEDSDGNKIPLTDATDAAREKVNEMREQFAEWIMGHETYKDELHRSYNDNYNNIVPTVYDGSHQTMPGMRTNGWPLRDFQKDAVYRIVTTGRGLLAHEVGTGKTATMVAAAMELRRLGLAKKPAIACLKANIDQVTAEAQALYPNAKILSTADMFDKDKRQEVLNRIATGDYDMVILTHDHLNMMRMKPESRAKFIEEELADLRERKLDAEMNKKGKIGNRVVKQLAKAETALKEKLREALAEDTKDQIYFEDSGIDQLFVDEAHLFKSLPCVSSKEAVKGVPTQRSQRATNMFARCRYLLDKNGGRGVVFATGTPIANTMAELYNMQRYLQYDKLKERGIHQFDNWAEAFGDRTTSLEVKLSGEYKDVERFNKFTNLPELRHMASDFMDILRVDNTFEKDAQGRVKIGDDGEQMLVVKRPKKFERTIASEPSDAITGMMADIHHRAAALAGKRMGRKGEDNMLNVCNDAKKGSIDLRLIDASAPDNPTSKANRAIAEVLRIYHEKPGTAQAIFSDLGVNPIDTPGGKFHLFGDIKRKLVKAGIPKNQIIDFSVEMSDEAKEAAQNAIRRGDIRIALGSTKRLGTGVNIQDRLAAVHHLDIPYVPADMEQREGRGWRSGNTLKDFEAYRYVQQGSADDLFWTILANKKSFIDQYMLGKGNRSMADLDAGSLTPQEMIAVATGDSEMMERLTLENEVKSLRRSQSRHKVAKAQQQKSIAELPGRIAAARTLAEQHRADMEFAKEALAKDFHADDNARWRESSPMTKEEIRENIAEHVGSYRAERIGRVRGFEVENSPGEENVVIVRSPKGHEIRATASLEGIEYAIRSIAKGKYHDAATRDLETAHSDLARLQSESGRGWGKEQQLQEKLERLERLKEQRAAFEAQVRAKSKEPSEDPEPVHTKLSLRM